jgi:hypothetical protein
LGEKRPRPIWISLPFLFLPFWEGGGDMAELPHRLSMFWIVSFLEVFSRLIVEFMSCYMLMDLCWRGYHHSSL